MELSKIVKIDFKKLKVGTEVFDILDGWITIRSILSDDWNNALNCSNNLQYEKDGRHRLYQRKRLVAMKVHLEAEDIPTIEKESNMNSFYVYKIDKKEKWKTKNSYYSSERFGTKYYTRTNAELVAKILNNKEA